MLLQIGPDPELDGFATPAQGLSACDALIAAGDIEPFGSLQRPRRGLVPATQRRMYTDIAEIESLTRNFSVGDIANLRKIADMNCRLAIRLDMMVTSRIQKGKGP